MIVEIDRETFHQMMRRIAKFGLHEAINANRSCAMKLAAEKLCHASAARTAGKVRIELEDAQ